MPTMDTLCFAGDDTALANGMSIFLFDKTPFEDAKQRIMNVFKIKDKLRYKVVQIFGDYYY